MVERSYINSVVVIVIMCLDATQPTQPTQPPTLPIRELSSIQYPILSTPVTLVLVTNLEFCIDSRVFSRFHNIINIIIIVIIVVVCSYNSWSSNRRSSCTVLINYYSPCYYAVFVLW